MKISLIAGVANGQTCADCAVRGSSVCAALDNTELRELEHLGRHVLFASRETVFAQEEMTTSFYNRLEGAMRLYKLLPDGRRQIVGFALPGDFLGMTTSARHNFSADAIGPVPCAGSQGLRSHGSSRINRISCAASMSWRFAN
jgi:CRP/FNR family transcriptional regulator